MSPAQLETFARLMLVYDLTLVETADVKLTRNPGSGPNPLPDPIHQQADVEAEVSPGPTPDVADVMADDDEDPQAFLARMRGEAK